MTSTYLKVPIFLFIFLSIFQSVNAQNGRRELKATRISTPPEINGSLDDAVWENAQIATDFYQYEPHNDRKASLETEVKVLYDDDAIYIGAIMYDSSPDSILTEMGLRDSGNGLNADRFWIDINPFNDGVNGFRFQVSASGVQTDMNMSGRTGNHGDSDWDAVWKSDVSITDVGWIVEMEIPYSALRFPKSNTQTWGVNFWREVRRAREVSSWNFVDRRIGNPIASNGILNGIDCVKPPLRLALYPYISNYIENSPAQKGWANTFNGGMDLKLGLNESFTMDMTLIPDFGQVQSDEEILNLSPYEVKYDEKRQFFTEGTELFGKADLFYSRRIGSYPTGYAEAYEQLDTNEYIQSNPLETRLINATKISGRTNKGLGLGLFNAISAPSHAIIKDSISDETREYETQPLTNYNIFVIDQSLKNNSYLSLINSNVTGSAKGYMANVTGTDFRFLDESNEYRVNGNAAISQQIFDNNDNIYGYKYNIEAGKVGGTWQYEYERSVLSDEYDQNDLGFLRHNNSINNHFSFSHNIFDPFWRFWTLSNIIYANTSYLYEPYTYSGMNIGYQMRMLFDTRFFINFSASYAPFSQKDFFEPRVPGRFYDQGEAMSLYLYYSSDYRKRLYADGSVHYYSIFSDYEQKRYSIYFRPSFRVNDRLNLSYRINYNQKINDIGYVQHINEDTIYFGKRHSPTITNGLITKYIFSNKLSLSFNLRHYWSVVEYTGDYYFLGNDGLLDRIDDELEINNINYNAFTIDMMLIWEFAPGSQLSLMWKNAIYSNKDNLPLSYINNLDMLLNEPQINSFSIKLLYYLDYQNLKHFFSS